MTNAIDLWKESNLLYDNGHYSRAFTLSFTALEEVGKFLIVSDYITGVASKTELEEAFRNHHIKTAYVHSNVQIDTTKDLLTANTATIIYDKEKFKHFFQARQASAYVDYKDNFEPTNPSTEITKDLAKQMIDKVQKEIDFIHYAEELNGRIGSKALYK